MHHIAVHCTNNSNMFHCSTIKIILPGAKKRNIEREEKWKGVVEFVGGLMLEKRMVVKVTPGEERKRRKEEEEC